MPEGGRRGGVRSIKQGAFDDYVLYWPNPEDGSRIPMSVWQAVRELRRNAVLLEELARKLTQEFEAGELQAEAAQDSLAQLERTLSRGHDEFSRRLASNGANGAIVVKDAAALGRQFAQFMEQQLDQARQASEEALQPISSWARGSRRMSDLS